MPVSHPQKDPDNKEFLKQSGKKKRGKETLPNAPPFAVKNRNQVKASKRIRGEIACAECRRLKIKCDRTIPCTTCVKRGCASLCPNGTIPPGDGSRFVVAATDHLHSRLAQLQGRMRSLEDSLAIVHAARSDKPHPLLTDPLVDEELEVDFETKPSMEESQEELPSLAKALATLHIEGEVAHSTYGSTGGSENSLNAVKEFASINSSLSLPELDLSYLGPDINLFARSFPFPMTGTPQEPVQATIESFLPPLKRAVDLVDTFLDHLSWMTSIVSRREIVEDLIPRVYDQLHWTYGPHELSLVYIVLGIGAMVDLSQPPYNLEAQHYYVLAKSSLALKSMLAEPSTSAVKALHLMSIFNGLSGKDSNMELSTTLLDLAGQVALSMGYHIDPSRFSYFGEEAYSRRDYFYNLLSGLLWNSIVTGRPPPAFASHIDCRIPTDEEEFAHLRGEPPRGFGIWSFKVGVDLLLPAIQTILQTKSPSYDTVMELDKKIRNWQAPSIQNFTRGDKTAAAMKAYAQSDYLDQIILYLHRPYFVQAMSNKSNPLDSPYAESIQAAYRSACVVLNVSKDQYTKEPVLCARIFKMWSYAFTAAIVVGIIAMRDLDLGIEPSPQKQFEMACALFRDAAQNSGRAARALPLLEFMLRRPYLSSSSASSETSELNQPQADSQPNSTHAHSSQLHVETSLASQHTSPPPIPSSLAEILALKDNNHGVPTIPNQQINTMDALSEATYHNADAFGMAFDSSDPVMASLQDIAWHGLFQDTSAPGIHSYGPDSGGINLQNLNVGLNSFNPLGQVGSNGRTQIPVEGRWSPPVVSVPYQPDHIGFQFPHNDATQFRG